MTEAILNAYHAIHWALDTGQPMSDTVAKLLSESLDNLAQAYFELTGEKIGAAA